VLKIGYIVLKTCKEDELYGRGDMHTGFWWEIPKERGCFEALFIDGRNIKMAVRQAGWMVVDWIYLCPYEDQSCSVLDMLIQLCLMDSATYRWLGGWLVSQSMGGCVGWLGT
jgi:hypothetical protein